MAGARRAFSAESLHYIRITSFLWHRRSCHHGWGKRPFLTIIVVSNHKASKFVLLRTIVGLHYTGLGTPAGLGGPEIQDLPAEKTGTDAESAKSG